MKDWVDIRGKSKHDVQIEFGSTGGAIVLADFCQVEDLIIENSATEGHWAIVGTNTSHWHIRNVDILAPFGSSKRGAGIKVTGTSWNTGFIENCVINVYTQTNHGIFLESDGVDLADVTMNDVFVDSFEATTGGSILLNNIIDTQVRDSYCRTSAAGYDLRVTGTSNVMVLSTLLEYGTTSLEIGAGATVEIGFSFATSVTNGGTLTYLTPVGGGDVVGPSSSVNNEIALFNGTTGKLIKAATGTGIVRASSGQFGTPGNVIESEITLADNTTNNVNTSRHGFVPKAPNVATQFLDGTGAWTVPSAVAGTYYMSPLVTGGDPTTSELVFGPDGDVVMVPVYF